MLSDIRPFDDLNYGGNGSTGNVSIRNIEFLSSFTGEDIDGDGLNQFEPLKRKVDDDMVRQGERVKEREKEEELERERTRGMAKEFEAGGFSDNTEDNTEDTEDEDDGESYRLADRSAGSREYLKSTLMNHAIWSDRTFWEQALWQCTMEQVSE